MIPQFFFELKHQGGIAIASLLGAQFLWSQINTHIKLHYDLQYLLPNHDSVAIIAAFLVVGFFGHK